jgi:hypothetical protein
MGGIGYAGVRTGDKKQTTTISARLLEFTLNPIMHLLRGIAQRSLHFLYDNPV